MPEFGPDCLIHAEFARQRVLYPGRSNLLGWFAGLRPSLWYRGGPFPHSLDSGMAVRPGCGGHQVGVLPEKTENISEAGVGVLQGHLAYKNPPPLGPYGRTMPRLLWLS